MAKSSNFKYKNYTHVALFFSAEGTLGILISICKKAGNCNP